MQPVFSANTGFLFKQLDFPDRLTAAARAGYTAVEFHDEAQTADLDQIGDLLSEHELSLGGLNSRMGEGPGCAAEPDAADRCRREIDQALATAERLNAPAVHVLAGRGEATDAAARTAYVAALHYALQETDRIVLIEPICSAAMPAYYLNTLAQAEDILSEIDHPRLKIMFDVFHIAMADGPDQVLRCFERARAGIGHVQIASVPDRAEPDRGEVDVVSLIKGMQSAGYSGRFGCEYKPTDAHGGGLDWARRLNLLGETA
ncbi:MAG: TIM barrel protein [Pseudomonadota bacterium]